jgi:cell division septum initiation protein DivIVA
MNELKTISIDGVEHDFNAFTNEQKAYVAQINDLNQKLGSLQMQADQFSVARDAFVGMLKQSLAKAGE